MDTKRQSFDLRFGDDLFEFVLSYLPIVDKLRLESVSKRFQKYIYNRQQVLVIEANRRSQLANGLSLRQLGTERTVCLKNLRSVLKKCRYIKTVIITTKWLDNKSQVLNTIANNCQNLKTINIDFSDVDRRVFEKFCKQFGQQLKHISLDSSTQLSKKTVDFHKQLIQSAAPNLQSLSSVDINMFDENNSIQLKRLVKINDLILFNQTEDKLRLLLDKSLVNLKYLDIFVRIVGQQKSNISRRLAIDELSQFKCLKVLKIFVQPVDCSDDFWPKTIELIANNCVLLDEFWFKIHSTTKFNCKQCFESLSNFSRLKCLGFESKYTFDSKPQPLDANCLINLAPNLLALDIRSEEIDDEFADGLDLIVPNLRRLTIDGSFISDYGLQEFSKLKSLTHFEITGSTKAVVTCRGVDMFVSGLDRMHIVRTGPGVRFKVKREIFKIIDLETKYPNIEFDIKYSN